MGNLVELKRGELRERVASFNEKVEEIREFLNAHERTGFAIVAYAKIADRNLTEVAAYSVDDALDSYSLPEMAKYAVIRIREQNG